MKQITFVLLLAFFVLLFTGCTYERIVYVEKSCQACDTCPNKDYEMTCRHENAKFERECLQMAKDYGALRMVCP